jgi:hypothetical protein
MHAVRDQADLGDMGGRTAMTLEAFNEELLQEVAVRAEASENSTESAFAAVVSDHLIEDGVLSDFVPCVVRQRGYRVDGYAFVPDEATLDLYVTDFTAATEIETLTKTAMDQAFRRVEGFFEKSLSPSFVKELEVAHPAWGLARQIQEEAASLSRVRFHLFTNRKLSSSVRELPSEQVGGHEWAYRVFDLATLQRLLTPALPEEIVVDFVEMFGSPLSCLPTTSSIESVTSYLAVIPGDWLASIYHRYGGRLLEQNVRTFLQARGKVNKGIRKTILEEPSMFFAYNNGISTTAAEAHVELDGSSGMLYSIRNLQIVNGGQTTASIFHVHMKERSSKLADIRVQMKLTIVPSEKIDEVVPRISQYSNSQNKISEADFFSNHPFHVRIESISRHAWAPPIGGSSVQTRWFYERARGQYANQQTYLTDAKKREFQMLNPRGQLITKTDLAKVVNTFQSAPHVVSLGAQKNFAHFATIINNEWKDNETNFNETWYRTVVAYMIIFRATERLVQDAPWYALGYRAQIVTYTIALLQDKLTRCGQAIDTERIWQQQQVGPELRALLLQMSEHVQQRLIEAAASNGIVNVTEWCKRKPCWDDILENVPRLIPASLANELRTKEDESAEKRSARKEQKLFNEVDAQVYVVEKGADYWARLFEWGSTGIALSPSELQALQMAAAMPRKLPNSHQCIKLLEVEKKARAEGFNPSSHTDLEIGPPGNG